MLVIYRMLIFDIIQYYFFWIHSLVQYDCCCEFRKFPFQYRSARLLTKLHNSVKDASIIIMVLPRCRCLAAYWKDINALFQFVHILYLQYKSVRVSQFSHFSSKINKKIFLCCIGNDDQQVRVNDSFCCNLSSATIRRWCKGLQRKRSKIRRVFMKDVTKLRKTRHIGSWIV